MAPMPPDEYPNRIKRARALMRERGMDGLIVTDTMHYSYYTGHKVASWMRSRPSIFVLPLEGAPALITWSGPDMFARLYQQPFPSWVEDRRIYPEVPFNKEPRVDWGIADILKERGLALGNARHRARAGNLARHRRGRFRVAEGAIAEGAVCRFRSRRVGLPPDQVGVGNRLHAPGLRDRRQPPGGAPSRICARAFPPRRSRKTCCGITSRAARTSIPKPPMVLGATGPNRTFQNGDVLYIDGGCNVFRLQDGLCPPGRLRPAFGAPAIRARRHVGHSQRDHRAHEARRVDARAVRIFPEPPRAASRVAELFGSSIQAHRARHRA